MALGKAVVSTRVGGIPEVLDAGAAGLLAEVGAIEDLSNCVMRLLDDAELRHRMGTAGARRVESDYHVQRRVRAIEHLYQKVLEEAA
jgi:glycosyltransferase involved in cell wall biosynthesis